MGRINMPRIFLTMLLAWSLAACSYFYAKPPAVMADSQVSAPYVIGPGDQLQISVWKNADLSVSAPVRPDGMISIPLLQDVRASGLTPEQLSSSITDGLSKFVRDPQVTVIVSNPSPRSQTSVKIVGEAAQPRVIAYFTGITLLDAIAEAGGLTEFADGNRAFLVRTVDGSRSDSVCALDHWLKAAISARTSNSFRGIPSSFQNDFTDGLCESCIAPNYFVARAG